MSIYSDKLKHPKWQKKRLEIFKRDEFQCQRCLDKENPLVVHHKQYIKNKEPWEYDGKDLITLCDYCHELYHEKYDNVDIHVNINKTDYYILEYYYINLIHNSSDQVKEVINYLRGIYINKNHL